MGARPRERSSLLVPRRFGRRSGPADHRRRSLGSLICEQPHSDREALEAFEPFSGWGDRLILDSIFYVLRSGCPWRMPPRDLAPPNGAHRWSTTWRRNGT
ncbi:transposase [Micromonospora sp. NPDC048830]|uniref:transposase n=1 Tax=Micromonospora sp. NPDC048830 TaxID=3364257 RepID=UPI003717857C